MTVVKCPYCGLEVVTDCDGEDTPLPPYRDGFMDRNGQVLGFRKGTHHCVGSALAARIFHHADHDN